MDCLTPKRNESDPIPNQDVCFKTLHKLTAISSSPRAPTIRDFSIIKPISRGAFGKVYLGYKGANSSTLFAIKVMRKSDMINKNMISQVITERNALALSRSPYCVTLFYSLQTLSYIYLVMEYMVGGDLKSLLAVTGYFDEGAARFYCAEMTLALQYLHGHGIVHRDIKPDNMLVSHTGHVKLTDFGLSKIELARDLEMSDLINCSPSLNARTPGQLLSLTSHLSFGSCEKKSGAGGGCGGAAGTLANGSHVTSTLMLAMNRQKSPEHEQELDTSVPTQPNNDSHVSGVSPFQSAEDIQVSFSGKGQADKASDTQTDSASSYYTCNSTLGNNRTSSSELFKVNLLPALSASMPVGGKSFGPRPSEQRVSKSDEGAVPIRGRYSNPNPNPLVVIATHVDKENRCETDSNQQHHQLQPQAKPIDDSVGTFDLSTKSNARQSKESNEDSGVSSRKSELSANIHCELSAIEKPSDHHHHSGQSKDEYSALDMSKSYLNANHVTNTTNNDTSGGSNPCCKAASEDGSTVPHKCFKLPACFHGVKRKRSIANRMDLHSFGAADGTGNSTASSSTGLTQEIDIMDIGSSTPKKRKAKTPLKGVLKVRSLSDDEMPTNGHLNVGTVMFSTPVSSQKAPRGGLLKMKSTRFALPSSADVSPAVQSAHAAGQLHHSVHSTLAIIGGGGGGVGAARLHAKGTGVSSMSVESLSVMPAMRFVKIADPAMSPINSGVSMSDSCDDGSEARHHHQRQQQPQVTPKNMQTPYRTPKSVRRVEGDHQRILGTPDYLSPELLLAQGHGPEVDWWALGVCLYEFMTGVPPFNDETPQKVFDNILSRNIEYPEGEESLSEEAVDAVEQFLTMDPHTRPTAIDVQRMPFFADLQWSAMESAEPPFIPKPDDPTDTGYFTARNVMQHLKLSSFDLEEYS